MDALDETDSTARLSHRISHQWRVRQLLLRWIAESFRSIQPRAIALGIIAEGEFDLDTLEQRLREEVTAGNSCIPAPR
jgi:hypothetical protein